MCVLLSVFTTITMLLHCFPQALLIFPFFACFSLLIRFSLIERWYITNNNIEARREKVYAIYDSERIGENEFTICGLVVVASLHFATSRIHFPSHSVLLCSTKIYNSSFSFLGRVLLLLVCVVTRSAALSFTGLQLQPVSQSALLIAKTRRFLFQRRNATKVGTQINNAVVVLFCANVSTWVKRHTNAQVDWKSVADCLTQRLQTQSSDFHNQHFISTLSFAIFDSACIRFASCLGSNHN